MKNRRRSLKKVSTSARHLLKLINEVLDISKIESRELQLEIKELNLKWLIESVIPSFEPLIKHKNLALAIQY